ncbi:MAG: SDR family NAD(P)-dependent oxidoreductase [Bacteroidota bacterium]
MIKSRNKVILITGCSSGFGFLSALKLAEKGHKVYATMRNLSKSWNLWNMAQQKHLKLKILQLDVTKRDTIEECLNVIKKEEGRLDVLINNAGYGLGGFFEEISDQEFRDIMETNFFGVLNVTRLALPLLGESMKGKVINLSSVSGFTSFPGTSAYNSTKWALEGFSESLRYELKPKNIDVILLEPGNYSTKMHKQNMRTARNSLNRNSPNYQYEERVMEVYNQRKGGNHDVNEVPDLIVKIIEKDIKKFRIPVGIHAKIQWIIKHVIPFSLHEKLVNNYLFGKLNKSKNLQFEKIKKYQPGKIISRT